MCMIVCVCCHRLIGQHNLSCIFKIPKCLMFVCGNFSCILNTGFQFQNMLFCRALKPNAKVSVSLGTESAHCVSIVFLL